MTVSPQWPQDGDRQQKAAGSGVESDGSSRLPALPPTLFKLPNLKRDHESRDVSQPPQASTPPVVETTTSPPANDVEKPSVGAAPPETSARPENSETDAAQKRPAPIPFRTDQPAGRSWMETMGSHGVVIVLLLIVIGAALVSGRKDRQPGLESLGETGQWDEGIDIDLPIPIHEVYESTEFASSADLDSSAQGQDVGLSTLQSDRPSSSPIADGFTHAQPAETPNPPLDDPDSSLVSLEPPEPSFTTANKPPGSPFGSLQANDFLLGPANFDALAASKRFENLEGMFTLPTLDDLADETISRDVQNTTDQTAPTFRLSPTPFGVKDWSRYLPTYEPRDAAGSGTIPTSE